MDIVRSGLSLHLRRGKRVISPALTSALIATIVSILMAFPGTTARAATPEQIDGAIKKGVDFIYSQQQKTGGRWEKPEKRVGDEHNTWPEFQGDSYGGFSSLATYALLAAGETPKDKRVADAVEFLKKTDIIGIYALGLRAQVWHLLSHKPKDQAELQKFIDADAARIIAGINTGGDNRGLWDYGTGKGPRIDHSVSQYGILGLWALQDSGAKVDQRYWKVFDEVWRSGQFPDGGWNYDSTPQHKADNLRDNSASMTAAGIATLFITQDNTNTDAGEHRGNLFNANIENGLRWITKHFGEVNSNYGWYGVERIGVASGTKFFGTTDWFQAGADKLISSQKPDGSWDASGGEPANTLTSTCFAVLFLARGKAPIMMNKVRYEVVDKNGKSEDGDWNERPRDLANLARWTGDQMETALNWQLVNLQVTPEELRDAPILYLAGDKELHLSDADAAKIKTFINEGGMVVGNADFNSKPFAESFQQLGTKLFGYEFRALEPSSPIWGEQFHLNRARTKVAALSNGIRELMILLDNADPGRMWQVASENKTDAFQLGANIFLYAVDKKNLVTRGQTNLVFANPAIKNNHTIKVARLQYGGNWDPEPGGWPRLAAIMHNSSRSDLDVQTVALGKGQLNAAPEAGGPTPPSDAEIRKTAFKLLTPEQKDSTEGDPQKMEALLKPKVEELKAKLAIEEQARLAKMARFKVAHLTGTTKFNLDEAQTDELRKFVANGGTLVIDSGGGSANFNLAAEDLLTKLFPDSAQKAMQLPLPPESPLYTLDGFKIDAVQYRLFARTMLGNLRTGRVCGIPVNGRIAVYFSKEDISAGLVGQPTDGIIGYTPDTATPMMRNIILIASPPPPPPPPATAPATAPVAPPAVPGPPKK
jgi:hypothetical protein